VTRQDGDSTGRIQEAIDTCAVDCTHWVPFEGLSQLQNQLDAMERSNPSDSPPPPVIGGFCLGNAEMSGSSVDRRHPCCS